MTDGKGLPEQDMSRSRPNPRSRVKSDVTVRPSTLFDQLYHEIIERRQHQLALEELGGGDATRESTAHDIKERLEHLKKLDPQRALAVVQKLMKP